LNFFIDYNLNQEKPVFIRLYKILVAGGWYAGIQTVLRLEDLLLEYNTDSEAVLIDKNAYHTLLLSLPETIVAAAAGVAGVEATGENAALFKSKKKNDIPKVILVSPTLLSGFPDSVVKWGQNLLEKF